MLREGEVRQAPGALQLVGVGHQLRVLPLYSRPNPSPKQATQTILKQDTIEAFQQLQAPNYLTVPTTETNRESTSHKLQTLGVEFSVLLEKLPEHEQIYT